MKPNHRRWVIGALAVVGVGWASGVAFLAWRGDITPAEAMVVLNGPILAGLAALVLQNLAVRRRLAGVERRLRAVHREASDLSDAFATSTQAIRSGLRDDLLRTYRQLEALQNLYAIVGVEHRLPASRVWGASPDLLLYLVDLVERRRPKLIVECGSGLSTVWFALAMRRFEVDGTVVALEHLEEFAEETRELVARHGLTGLVDVRLAPLEEVDLGGDRYEWYGRVGWTDLTGIDMLFVDGPPGETGDTARYPALPLLVDRLASDGAVVLDDLVRSDEQRILERWTEEFAEFKVRRIRLEKHAALLTR